ncbi:hypothetical protein [Kosakonia radicincitans]|uniref:hypothetical protein n=1 Tax=Kosakonia radicincitans TaxID=283686 RepID=UPI001D0660A6|nr:hypothetical protein [Kosakonia radicincitans]
MAIARSFGENGEYANVIPINQKLSPYPHVEIKKSDDFLEHIEEEGAKFETSGGSGEGPNSAGGISANYSGIPSGHRPHTPDEDGQMPILSENDTMSISREELDAKLERNKAEAEAIAAEMRREMASWREQNNAQLAQITISINAISSKLDGKMDSVDGDVKAIAGKFEGFQGQVSGINTAINGIQSGISTRLAIFGAILAVIVALPGILSAFKDSPPSNSQTSLPIIIQVPSQQTTTTESPQTKKSK